MLEQQELVQKWVKELQDKICREYEAIEEEFEGSGEPGKFEEKNWKRDGGGGGKNARYEGECF